MKGGQILDNKTYYYARVLSTEQSLDRQLEAFKNMGADTRDIITNKTSGKNLECAGYQSLKSTILYKGDILVVKSLDRLSGNKADIKNELEGLGKSCKDMNDIVYEFVISCCDIVDEAKICNCHLYNIYINFCYINA